MTWWALTILVIGGIAGGVILSSLNLFVLALWLRRREAYSSFLHLSAHRKITFFRLLVRDEKRQIPLYVRLIPVALTFYLSNPFDIVPDFIPVLGDLDDYAVMALAFVLIIKLTPRSVTQELLQQALQEPASLPSGEGQSTEETEG